MNGNDELSELKIIDGLSELKEYIEEVGVVDSVIYSDVHKDSNKIEEILHERGFNFIRSNHLRKLPFKLNYHTPQTLGDDRIAAVAAAFKLYPNKNVLIIDSGTCITYDLIDDKAVYNGGAISPGIKMRFKALHEMTGGLPYIEFEDQIIEFPGKSTEDSIKNGVLNGMIHEAQSFIDDLSNKYEELIVLIGGGDRKYFETNLKGNIFARENLILEGLNSILLFNDSHK